jgi:DNA polymerase III gamma/tau subunit
VELDSVLELLGAADADLLFEAVDAVAAEDPKAALHAVERLSHSGRDPAQFARDLLAHLRHLLVIQTTGEVPDSFVVTASAPDRLRAQAAAIGPAALVRAIDELAESLAAMREGDDSRMAIELALLKAARPDLDPAGEGLLRRVERLEKRFVEDPSHLGEGPKAEAVSRPEAASESPPTPEASDDEEAAAEPKQRGEPIDAEEPIDLERVLRVWPAVIDQVRQSGSAMLSALFEGARPIAVDSDDAVLRIGFPAGSTFNKRKAEAAEHRERFTEALRAILGEQLRPVYVLLDSESGGESEDMDEEELLERIKSEFDAEEVSSEGKAQ